MDGWGGRPLLRRAGSVYGVGVGYIILIVLAVVLVPIVYVLFARRSTGAAEGQEPIGKPVMRSEPAADEATPAASSIQKDTSAAQRRTPAS